MCAVILFHCFILTIVSDAHKLYIKVKKFYARAASAICPRQIIIGMMETL